MKMKVKKKKNQYNPDRKHRFCDPGACDNCQYIGDGDFLCDVHQTIVVSDWEPTEDHMICKRQNRKEKEGKPRGKRYGNPAARR